MMTDAQILAGMEAFVNQCRSGEINRNQALDGLRQFVRDYVSVSNWNHCY
jgi:hypothetical protein